MRGGHRDPRQGKERGARLIPGHHLLAEVRQYALDAENKIGQQVLLCLQAVILHEILDLFVFSPVGG